MFGPAAPIMSCPSHFHRGVAPPLLTSTSLDSRPEFPRCHVHKNQPEPYYADSGAGGLGQAEIPYCQQTSGPRLMLSVEGSISYSLPMHRGDTAPLQGLLPTPALHLFVLAPAPHSQAPWQSYSYSWPLLTTCSLPFLLIWLCLPHILETAVRKHHGPFLVLNLPLPLCSI